jgi:2,3-bisphosphoglycerate-dependent phosphoglycerate mutase
MRLVVVRHGESTWNKENLFTGWTDVGLSERGVAEAGEAGDLLTAEGYDFDICFTSYLKRSIRTLNLMLERMDREWLPVRRDWRINERHYGALQGLNKAEVAAEYGDEQVLTWRRSYDTPPPALEPDDPRSPAKMEMFRNVPAGSLPLTESLRDTVARVVPFYEEELLPLMRRGERVLIAAHGNSIRALLKHLEGISDEDIVKVNIPTGVPLVFEFDEDFGLIRRYYLGDRDDIAARISGVAGQAKR